MDNLESLFNKKQYSLIVNLTEESSDPKERILRLASLVILGKDNEALDEIENNQDMYDKNYPYKTMKMHFELLFKHELFDEAKLALKHYQDLPYISQEVEEYLRSIPNQIDDLKNHKDKSIPVDEICNRLESEKDSELLLEALAYIRVYNLNSIIDSLKVLLVRKDVRQDLRAFALFALMEQEYSKEVEYLALNGVTKVIPSSLKTPFENASFLEINKKLDALSNNNITLKETAANLFAAYVINSFPDDSYKSEVNKTAEAILSLAKNYIQEEDDLKSEDVLLLKKKIKQIIEVQ